jgi:uncharacterized protein (TIGR03000 family)
MLRKVLSGGGTLLLVFAAIAMTPESAWSAGHGGGGGGHGGGGFQGGGFHGGGYGSAHYGGSLGGYAHGGYYHGGFYGHPYGYSGYGHYRHGYGYYGYGLGGYYPYYNDYAYPYIGGYDYPDYDYGAYDPYPAWPDESSTVYQSFYRPLNASTDNRAHVNVSVPVNAQLWFQDTLTSEKGTARRFESPALVPGKQYRYEVRAQWMENGREVTQTQNVDVYAGASVNMKFPVPPESTMTGVPAN